MAISIFHLSLFLGFDTFALVGGAGALGEHEQAIGGHWYYLDLARITDDRAADAQIPLSRRSCQVWQIFR